MDEETAETILKITEEDKPETVEKLAELAKAKLSQPETIILKNILQLQDEGRISLKKTPMPPPRDLTTYLKTEETRWYWVTLILVTATAISAFTIPENAFPFIYIRYVLSTIFVLWLPGYSFTKALFPTENQTQQTQHSLDAVERAALSIGMSLALVPIVGLLLNYTPWGIRLIPIVLSLLVLTIMFATAGVLREHQTRMKQ